MDPEGWVHGQGGWTPLELHKAVGSRPRSADCYVMSADTCLTADTGMANSIPAQSHIFMEIDHELISMVILLPSADSRRFVVS